MDQGWLDAHQSGEQAGGHRGQSEIAAMLLNAGFFPLGLVCM